MARWCVRNGLFDTSLLYCMQYTRAWLVDVTAAPNTHINNNVATTLLRKMSPGLNTDFQVSPGLFEFLSPGHRGRC